jgi:tripartite-type tricarboxylate transporter receptor subunit TctC
MKKRMFMGGLLGASLANMVPPLRAQTRPVIQLVVPFAAGGLADSLARLLASTMQRLGKQTLVVVNRPGASGAVAAGALIRSRPDEAIFLLSGISQVLQPLIAKPHSSVAEVFDGLRYMHLLCHQDSFMVVSSKSNDFFAYHRKRMTDLNLGSLGVGSVGHLMGVTLAREADLKHVHIPYNGSPGIIQGLLSGEIHYAFMAYENFKSLLLPGGLVPLAVASEKSSVSLPNVPTAPSLGFKSVNRGTWFALSHAAHADAAVVASFFADMEDVLKDQRLLTGMSEMGLIHSVQSGEKLKKFIASEQSYWSKRISEVL